MESEKMDAEPSELERVAMEEILREAKNAAERAKEMGAAGWLKPVVPRTNKRFLHNTLVSTMRNPRRSSHYRRSWSRSSSRSRSRSRSRSPLSREHSQRRSRREEKRNQHSSRHRGREKESRKSSHGNGDGHYSQKSMRHGEMDRREFNDIKGGDDNLQSNGVMAASSTTDKTLNSDSSVKHTKRDKHKKKKSKKKKKKKSHKKKSKKDKGE